MTWAQSLGANYTDGIVVLHKGRIVYERYFGALRPDGQHIAMSVTKSFFGTIGAMLVADGTLDANAKASPVRARAEGLGLRRRHGAPAARHDHRAAVQRELRRPERRDLEPRARRQRVAAPAGLSGPEHLLRVPAHGEEAGQPRRGLRLQDRQHRRAGLGDRAAPPASRWARTCRSASGASSAPSRTPTSPSTPSAPSSPAAA